MIRATFASKPGHMQTEQLIQTLIEQTRQHINKAEKLKAESADVLNRRPAPASWNVLECLQHLNLYGDFYIPAMQKAVRNSATKPEAVFKSGILGGYFAQSMLPKEKLNKMKTFRDKDPLHANLDRSVIDTFIHQQFLLIDLLNDARGVSLNKVKIPTSISHLLRLKLGDTFRFVINHNIRHMAQVEKILQQLPAAVAGFPVASAR